MQKVISLTHHADYLSRAFYLCFARMNFNKKAESQRFSYLRSRIKIVVEHPVQSLVCHDHKN